MSGDIYVAAAAALSSEMRLQMISNNLANANTVGFKMDRGHFNSIDPADLPANTLQNADLAVTRADLFWNNFGTYTDHSSGALKRTDNDFDLALVGKGFFCVQVADGERYTRKGDFTLNEDGVLVTRDGWPVLGEGGEITIDSKENPHRHAKFAVDVQGNVTVDGQQVDRLRIVDFDSLNRLRKVGATLFAPKGTGPREIDAENVSISQGFVETSNVNSIAMLTEMIEVLRGYESYQKVIKNADETYSNAIGKVGTL